MRPRSCDSVTLVAALMFLGCAGQRVAPAVTHAPARRVHAVKPDSLTAPPLQAQESEASTRGALDAPAEKAEATGEYLRCDAQVLGVAVADLQGGGGQELLLLTPDSVLVFGNAGRIAGLALSEKRGDWVSRDRIGALAVDGVSGTVYVNTSDLVRGEVHQWDGEGFKDLGRPLPGFPLGLRHTQAGVEPALKRRVAGTNYFKEEITVFDELRGAQTQTLYFHVAASGDIDPNHAGPENILLGLDGRIAVYDDFFSLVHSDERAFGGFARLFGTRLVVTSARAPGDGDYWLVLEWNAQGWDQVYRSREYLGSLVSADLGDLDGDGQDEIAFAENVGSHERPLTVIHVEAWPQDLFPRVEEAESK